MAKENNSKQNGSFKDVLAKAVNGVKKFFADPKGRKITVIAAGALIVILAVILVLVIVFGGINSVKLPKVSKDYTSAIAKLTPSDAETIIGEWKILGIKNADGKAVDPSEVLGRALEDSDKISFMDDSSFVTYIGDIISMSINEMTGRFALTGSDITLAYNNGRSAAGKFNQSAQTIELNSVDGNYIYVLIRNI